MQCVCDSTNIKKAYKKQGWQYYKCSFCKSIFLSPFPSNKQQRNFYNTFEYKTGFIEKRRIISQSIKILKNICSINPYVECLLDIGCGPGFLLNEANKRAIYTVGIEPSISLVKYARENFNVRVFRGYLDKDVVKRIKIKFDAIVISHVIEHIVNPINFLYLVSKLLKRGGVLYIETPNIESWLAFSEKEDFTFLTPPEHVYLYSKKGITRLVQKLNDKFILRKISTYSYPEHLIGIIRRQWRQIRINIKFNKNSTTNKKKRGFNNKNSSSSNKLRSNVQRLLFDKIMAVLCTPILNIGDKGTFLEFYFQKK